MKKLLKIKKNNKHKGLFQKLILYSIMLTTLLGVSMKFGTIDAKAWTDPAKVNTLDNSYFSGGMFLTKDSKISMISKDNGIIYDEKKKNQWVRVTANGNKAFKLKITKCAIDDDGKWCDVVISNDTNWTKNFFTSKYYSDADIRKDNNYYSK